MSDQQRNRIETFLATRYPSGAKVTRYTPISGGYSRLMAEFVAEIDGVPTHLIWRGDPPAERQIIVTDRQREFALLSALSNIGGAPVARPLHFDPDGTDLGTISMILEYVEGEQLMTLLRKTDETRWSDLTELTCRLAAAIHGTDLDALPAELERPTGWSQYLDGCIESWRELDREQVEPSPMLRYVTVWLDRNRPPEVPLALVHGDFQSPNILIDGDRATVIDWEFGHIGDPREDLGYFLALAALSPPDPTQGDPDELCRIYRKHSGLSEEQLNPATLAYFSILPFGPMIRRLSGQIADLVAGRNRSLQTANLTVMVTAMMQGWITLIRTLDGIDTTATGPAMAATTGALR